MTVNDDYHKWILFTEEEIDNICNELQGRIFDKQTGTYIKYREEIVNETGTAGIKMLLKSVLNPNTFLSNITDEEDLKKTQREICLSALQSIMLNRAKWQLKLKDIGFIMGLIMNYVDFAARRPYKEGEREFAKGTMHTHRSVDERGKQYEVIESGDSNFKDENWRA